MATETLLAAVDFSETATNAAKFAIEQFAPDAELVLLHVIDLPARPSFARNTLPPADVLAAAAREHATACMHELSSYLTWSSVRAEIRVGTPHDQVARVAAEVGASVVVIGPHGGRPRASRFLGTTADRIARTSPVPVLVATNPPNRAPRHILVPIDDDDTARAVLRWTRDLAARFASDVTLLHVWSNAEYSHVASMSYATSRSDESARQAITQELDDAARAWLAESGRAGLARDHVDVMVAHGNAGDVTVERAATAHADLIVVGRHGSHELAAALLGSTVGTVLHGARCPVLIVPRPSAR
jgi:nucleotide-binding universal stress UspA family protein